MSLISQTSLRALQQPQDLIVAAEGALATYDVLSHQPPLLLPINSTFTSDDFVIDESFDIEFLLQQTNSSPNTTSIINSSLQSYSNENESREIKTALASDYHELDQDFIENQDVNMLLNEADAAIQSPSADIYLPVSEDLQLVGHLELDALLESIANEVSEQNESAAVDSPSAEITYSHLTAMTPFYATVDETSSSALSSDQLGGEMNPSAVFGQSDETTSSSFSFDDDDDDDDSSRLSARKSVSSSSSSHGGRVKSSGGAVSKAYKSKKESNKAAAERYRNKKQQEKQELFAECERHEKRNRELKAEIEEVQAELNFIKNLLVEALLTKNNSGAADKS